MKHDPIPHRGGAPVGYVAELPMLETGFVIYMRLWCAGGVHQQQITRDFKLALGERRGAQVIAAFAELCSLCVKNGRRPLMRHSVNCKCLGADESCFANFVATAAEGTREDAMFIATLIVQADMAPLVAALAQDVGLALKQMFLKAETTPVFVPDMSQTLH